MSLVTVPLSGPDPAATTLAGYVRAMGVGQHVMAVLLTVIGVVRAALADAPIAAAVAAGGAFLAWHLVGALWSARSNSTRVAVVWLLGLVVVWIAATVVSAEFVWLAFLLWLLAATCFRWCGVWRCLRWCSPWWWQLPCSTTANRATASCSAP